jgi:hypothetical protein
MPADVIDLPRRTPPPADDSVHIDVRAYTDDTGIERWAVGFAGKTHDDFDPLLGQGLSFPAAADIKKLFASLGISRPDRHHLVAFALNDAEFAAARDLLFNLAKAEAGRAAHASAAILLRIVASLDRAT